MDAVDAMDTRSPRQDLGLGGTPGPIRTDDIRLRRRPGSEPHEDFRDVATADEDVGGPFPQVPPRSAAAYDDPIEGALADGVRAIADAMRRAEADALPALAERMATLAGELKARREARVRTDAPASVVVLDERRKR